MRAVKVVASYDGGAIGFSLCNFKNTACEARDEALAAIGDENYALHTADGKRYSTDAIGIRDIAVLR